MAEPLASSAAADPAAIAANRVRVLLPLPLAGAFDYAPPAGESPPAPGSFVRVPLGSRERIGVVWDGAAEGPAPRRPELRRFVERVALYAMAPPGAVLRMVMSVSEALLPPRPQRMCVPTERGVAALADNGLTPARRRALLALRAAGAMPAAALARRAGCGVGVVRALIAAGLVEERPVAAAAPPSPPPDWRDRGPPLSADQAAAAARLIARIAAGGFGVALLDGVSGAGKTETYFAAIAAVLAAGRQVLVLLPEIALSAQWLERFRERFGALPAQWHS